MNNEDVVKYIISWGVRFPIDRWWRKKHNIAFNSSVHRESSFLDQLIEYEEDKLFNSIEREEEYKPGSGDWLKKKKSNNFEEDIVSLRDEFRDELKNLIENE